MDCGSASSSSLSSDSAPRGNWARDTCLRAEVCAIDSHGNDYRVTCQPCSRALEVDFLGDVPLAAKSNALFHPSKGGHQAPVLDGLWQEKAATAPRSLASIVLSDSVVEAVRTELRRQTSFNGEVDQLRQFRRRVASPTETGRRSDVDRRPGLCDWVYTS